MSALSEAFIESISTTLQSANVPCVLWGHCLLITHGIPSIVASIDFVVPDIQLQTAVKALHTLDRLEPCHDIRSCPAGPHDRYSPGPAHHFDIHGSELTVGIYVQSETLWFLPRFDQTLVYPQTLDIHPHFVFASDKLVLPPTRLGRGKGAFSIERSTVLVPRAIVLLEAFLRLYARDSGKKIGGFAMQMICYVEEYIDDDGYLNQCKLPEPLQTFYDELKGDEKPVRLWAAQLRDALGVPQPTEDGC